MVMKTKDSKMLVIGTQQLFQSINNVDGHNITEAEIMKHFASQGIYFFLKFYRQDMLMCMYVYMYVYICVCAGMCVRL